MDPSDHEIFRRKAEEIFNILDKQGKGTLEMEDLKKGFRALHIPLAQHDELLKQLQFHKENKVTKRDFDYYADQQFMKITHLFEKLNKRGDKKLSLDELKQGLKEFDPESDYSEAVCKGLFQYLDRNKNGTIDFEDWCEFLILIPKVNLESIVRNWEIALTVSDPHDMIYYELHNEIEQDKRSHLKNFMKSFGAGALAGAISRTLTAPFDRLKIIYQVNYTNTNPPNILRGLTDIYLKDGFKGLFRGNLVNILKSTPETAIRLSVFERLKASIKGSEGEYSSEKLFMAGAVSGVVASFAVFPMDVIKTRLAATPSGTYLGIGDVIRKIWMNEGHFLPFYRGLQAQISASIPNSGLNLMSYELLKKIFLNEDQDPNPHVLKFMTIGGASALFSSTLLYPFQIVTSRLIMQGVNDVQSSHRYGMIGIMNKMYVTEGFLGFFKGYYPAITKIIAGNAISFGIFEVLKRTFGVDFRKY